MSGKLEILFLSNKQVNALAADNMSEVMHDMERVLSLLDEGKAISPNKAVLSWGETVEDENKYGRINAMPGYIGGEYDMAGIKWIGSNPQNYKLGLPRATVLVVLNDPVTKIPVAVSDGTTVSAKRTGAIGGVAAKYLSVSNASNMTIFGAGAQGRTQLEAILLARPTIKNVYINDAFFEKAQEFAEEMSKKYGITVTPIKEPEQYCSKSEIIVTVTTATEPIVEASWIKPGTLMINMADYEFNYDCVKIADKIAVDNWENIKHRKISTVALMYHEGLIKDEDITAHIGEIINGKKPGRESDDEIIYFNAVGMGIEDIAVVTRAYKKALAQGVGTKVTYWE